MFPYRVTKYDPVHRDELGRYARDDWTSFADVGRECAGAILTLDEYERVESTYIDSALGFLREADVRSLSARGVENASGSSVAPTEGASLEPLALGAVMQGILREDFWCRLEAPAAFVHFGWDYYMYVGVPARCESACEVARRRGLFVEPFESPYRESDDPHEEAS
ncbi:hypothetical protein [Alienimonas chondri]|uniref:Uncharacterized protein n=1 Tax=Alienimonas chondri TaxID=2681879 RepID=A0ABX1VF93_9PLAN|nr:hypothetical protein [Alienimonas chondri]NNJ26091.1 hypothetical protein [Alienimonas chondri]